MKTRHYNDAKKPLPEGQTGTYSLECATQQDWNDAATNYIFEGETVRLKTAVEIYEESKPYRKAALVSAGTHYQNARLPGSSYTVVLNHASISPKSAAVVAWVEALWDIYDTKKADMLAGSPYDTDFSSAGELPHSFSECKAEIKANK